MKTYDPKRTNKDNGMASSVVAIQEKFQV